MFCLLGVGVAVGLFVAGRGTASQHHEAAPSAGYAQGLADGIRQGRAEQEAEALPSGARDGARAAFDDGYRAGVNDAFAGYDGGWSYGTPYVVTLARGGPGITYRIASRTPVRAGVDYYLCPGSRGLCQRPRS
jgi:hypothetical protein